MMRPIDINEMPDWIERLKELMGISIIPSNQQHPLYDHFVEYERSRGTIQTFNELSKKVVELGTIAVNVLLFEKSFTNGKIKKHIRKHLNDPNLINGLLFEFRAAAHFLHQHKEVHWMPNIGNKSEFDLKVITNSGKIVNIECTRRNNTLNKSVLIGYISNTIITKQKQINKRRLTHPDPVLVAILLPQNIDWENDIITFKLDKAIYTLLQKHTYQIISGISIVCSRVPIENRLNNFVTEYDTALPVITYINQKARYPFPNDFYYNLHK